MDNSVSTFVPFGAQHWAGTGIAVAIAVLLPLLLRWRASPQGQDTARKVLAVCLFIDIFLGPAVRAGVYGMPLAEHLPLHLCGMTVTLGAFMLWTRSYRLYEVLYYWGTGGALVALMTPDVLQAFPHPVFLLFFLGHGLGFMAIVFATLVMGFRPRPRSLLVVMPVTAAYALLMVPVNLLLGSNYLFLLAKPSQPSPLDWFGPWPMYLPGLIGMTACAFFLLYAPFAVIDIVRSRKLRGMFAAAVAVALGACGDNTGTGGGDNPPGVVNLSVEPGSVTESESPATVTVTAAIEGGAARAETTVTVSLTGDSAGTNDFSEVAPLEITIAAGAGSASGSLSFVATDDDEDEEDETVRVTGTAPGLTVNAAALTIVDNDEPSESGWVAGQFLPASTFAGQCRSPRLGADPETGNRYPDIQGRTVDENNWLRSWSNRTYLWYDEIIDRDPGRYDDPLDYFDLMRTTARTDSGAPRDRFHFTYDTEDWVALSQSGETAGYGASWTIISRSPPREAAIAYTDPDTPASDAGLRRGARIVSVNGIDFVNAGDRASVAAINAALYPESAGETHSFEFRDVGEQTARAVELTSEIIASTPVQHVGALASPAGATVGYMLFNDHIRTAEPALVAAVRTLNAVAGGIEDLIVDMRYNGGGFLYIGSQLAYMIAGEAATAGRVYERLEFNDKHPETNPVTGRPLSPIPFYSTTETDSGNQRLPALNLRRVLMLTGPNTCSASESIINGLRGIGIEVILIGEPTCGKPYGFYPADNCGTTYFTIQFRGVNARGYGDYGDGFVPTPGAAGDEAQVPGCRVADDLTRALGDPAEGRLAAALEYGDTGACPISRAISRGFGPESNAPGDPESRDGMVRKPPWLTNRIMRE